MPVKIVSVKQTPVLSTDSIDWLLGSIKDVKKFELEVAVQTFAVASTKTPFILNATDGFVGTGWVWDKSNRFKDFRIGDSVHWFNKLNLSQYDFTIIDKNGDGKIRLNTPFPGIHDNNISDSSIFSISTPITALRYNWNFIENSDPVTFNSKISGTKHELVIKSIAANVVTVLPMLFLGEVSYQTGYATAQGISIDLSTGVYTSNFKITHFTTITPYFLAEQWDDTLVNRPPKYFNNDKCLKAIFDVQAAREYTDPNWIESLLITEKKGNTGWFGENFNTGITNYTISDFVIKDLSDNVIGTDISLSTTEVKFEFLVNNIVDNPFSNTHTKFELSFIKAPNVASEYALNQRTIDQNFIDDRVIQTVGSAAVNGQQFGVSGRQVFKNVAATFLGTTHIKVTGHILFGVDALAVFSESVEPRYIFDISIQNHTFQTAKSDLVRLPIKIAPFFVDKSDPGLVKIDIVGFRHYEEGLNTEGTQFLKIGPEDEVASYSQITVDHTDRATDDISIKSFQAKVKAKNTVTGDEFILDAYYFSFAGVDTPNGIQTPDITLPRIFKIPTEEIRKSIVINRRFDLESGAMNYYGFIFPFLVRWEYWVKLAGVAGDFYSQNQANKGQNHDWFHYTNLANWQVAFEMRVNMLKNGTPLPYFKEQYYSFFNYAANPNYSPKTIKSFRLSPTTELAAGGKKFLLKFEDTLIQADFTRTDAVPDITNYVANLHIEVFEQGGIEDTRRMSSKWPTLTPLTWFKPIDLSNKTVLSLIATNTIRCQAIVSKDELPNAPKFSVAARIYEKEAQIVCVCPIGWDPNYDTGFCERTIPGTEGTVGKTGNEWAFGKNAGVSFNTLDINGHPIAILTRALNTLEGCAVASDKDTGAMLVYTDGVKVYNGSDALRNSLNDLKGGPSATSSAIIVKLPGSGTQYYIFTCGSNTGSYNGGPVNQFEGRYSIYDITLSASAGGLVSSNVHLASGDYDVSTNPSGLKYEERISAISANGTTWIIYKGYQAFGSGITGDFYVYPLTGAGVGTRVVSTGSFSSFSHQGYIKVCALEFAPNMHYMVEQTFDKCYLWDFNSLTGQINNQRTIYDSGSPSSGHAGYGAEFSPSGKYLYISFGDAAFVANAKPIYRFDVSSGIQATIIASRGTVATVTAFIIGSLQLGPNGRIYFPIDTNPSSSFIGPTKLSSIDDPDNDDITMVGYSFESVDLGGKQALWGLPTFDTSTFIPTITETLPCGKIAPM